MHFAENNLLLNYLLTMDSYKVTHWDDYPAGTKTIESYFECRGGALFKQFPFYGLQGILKDNFAGQVLTKAMIDQATDIFKVHFGNDAVFNRKGWLAMRDRYDGRLPLRIRALPEGTVVKPGVMLFNIKNTDPDFAYLTNVSETVLMQTWYPTTVAALGYAVRQNIAYYLKATGCGLAGLDFMLQDFGFRGVSSVESAGIGGAAHLLNFKGSDTLAALAYAHDRYNADLDKLMFSVIATEHSIMTALGRDGEAEVVRGLLARHRTGILSVVADSYDIYNFVRYIVGQLFRAEIMARDGVFVIRPDSVTPQDPTPEQQMVTLCNILWEVIGGTVNDSGYKVLDPHVRLLWGDGIDIDGICKIMESMMRAGYAICNIACFGMGGGLLQKVNRDTQRCAIKACAIEDKDGVWHDQYKEPLDPTKKSLRGRLKTIERDGELVTVRVEEDGVDLLRPVFENGELLVDDDFESIRARARLKDEVLA